MVIGEKSRITRLLVVAVFGTFLVHSVAAQESSASVQSAGSLAKKLKPNGLVHTGVQIAPTPIHFDGDLKRTSILSADKKTASVIQGEQTTFKDDDRS